MPRLEQLEEKWGLQSTPLLTAIDASVPEHSALFVGRALEIERTYAVLERWPQLQGGKIALVGGAPGVGKTTFIKFLITRFVNCGYVPLVDYSPAIFQGKDYSLTDQDYLYIFAKIESFLLSSQENNHHLTDQLGRIFEATKDSDERQSFVVNYLIEKMTELAQRRFRNDKMYLILDNLDFLSPKDQLNLLRILSVLTRDNFNIVVVFVGRPLLLSIAQLMPREFVGSHAEVLSFLQPINFETVLESRFKLAGAPGYDKFCTEQFLREIDVYVDGNLALALKIANKLYTEAVYVLQDDKSTYDLQTGVDAMLGESLANINIIDSGENSFGFVPNILLRYKDADKVPPILLLISLLKDKRSLDHKLVDDFNRQAKQFDPTNPDYSLQDLIRLTDWTRGTRLTRRLQIGDIENFIKYVNERSDVSDIHFYFGITNTGLFVLKMLSSEKYRRLAKLEHMPFGFQKFVNQIHPEHFRVFPSHDWVERD
jgi:hypothetical protein